MYESMRLLRASLCVVILAACGGTYNDPFPAAEVTVWRSVLKEQRDPPRTIYVPHAYVTQGGAYLVTEWTVVVGRAEDTLPAESFLCPGYRLAHLSQPFDVLATLDQFELDDVEGWRAYEEACTAALR